MHPCMYVAKEVYTYVCIYIPLFAVKTCGTSCSSVMTVGDVTSVCIHIYISKR